MRLVVIDFEATCLKNGDYDAEFIKKQEIIEVGMCIVEPEEVNTIHQVSLIVKPKFNPLLTDFCVELTGITQDHVDKGLPFAEALAIMEIFFKPGDIFCAWGNFDASLLKKNCELHDIKNPCEDWPHINVKQFAVDWFGIEPCGIKAICDMLGIPFQGQLHRGLNDASNIVNVLKQIQIDDCLPIGEAFDEYSKIGKDCFVNLRKKLEAGIG